MLEDQLGHFKHGNAIFAIEDLLELVVGLDNSPIFRVLQIVAADIIPHFAGHFGSGNRVASDDRREFVIGLNRFHKSCSRRPLPVR